jgi:hypothetical protein
MPGAVPPTTSTLPHAQRMRLMRSTRKVEALLGETPLLSGDLGSSSNAAAPSANPAGHNLRPVLIVRLPCILPGATHSPLSATSAISFNSPVSAVSTAGVAEEEIARRRKMATKLSRTLGENIPPELMLPSTSTPARRLRRASSMTTFDLRGNTPTGRRPSTKEGVSSTLQHVSASVAGSVDESSVCSSGGSEKCLISGDENPSSVTVKGFRARLT